MTGQYNRDYVQKQVNLYNTSFTVDSRAGCLWRVASHTNLFPIVELPPDGSLTVDQVRYTASWLASEGFQLEADLFAIA